MILTVAICLMIIGLTGFTTGIFLLLKRQSKEAEKNQLWNLAQFKKINEAIARMINILWPEPKEENKTIN